jgi:hypothetical protein
MQFRLVKSSADALDILDWLDGNQIQYEIYGNTGRVASSIPIPGLYRIGKYSSINLPWDLRTSIALDRWNGLDHYGYDFKIDILNKEDQVLFKLVWI